MLTSAMNALFDLWSALTFFCTHHELSSKESSEERIPAASNGFRCEIPALGIEIDQVYRLIQSTLGKLKDTKFSITFLMGNHLSTNPLVEIFHIMKAQGRPSCSTTCNLSISKTI